MVVFLLSLKNNSIIAQWKILKGAHFSFPLCYFIKFDFNLILTKSKGNAKKNKDLLFILLKYIYVTSAKWKDLHLQLNFLTKLKMWDSV